MKVGVEGEVEVRAEMGVEVDVVLDIPTVFESREESGAVELDNRTTNLVVVLTVFPVGGPGPCPA